MHPHHSRPRRRGFGVGRGRHRQGSRGHEEAGHPLSISDLDVGEAAVIVGYRGGGSSYRSKLLSMGLTRGTKIRLTKVAPMGDPVEIDVRDFSLSLRKDEARVLLLERSHADSAEGRTEDGSGAPSGHSEA
jgi:ferrous iron transport protein A